MDGAVTTVMPEAVPLREHCAHATAGFITTQQNRPDRSHNIVAVVAAADNFDVQRIKRRSHSPANAPSARPGAARM